MEVVHLKFYSWLSVYFNRRTIFKFTNATEVIHGIWLYRLITLFAFIFIMLILYGCYRLYAKDYLITKSFHITPVTPTVITTIVGSVVIFILMTIIALLKPINYESSLLATLFFYLFL